MEAEEMLANADLGDYDDEDLEENRDSAQYN